jgi:hypothetical protein
MRNSIFFLILSFLCISEQKYTSVNMYDNNNGARDSVFTEIAFYPEIRDSTKFISDLLNFCGIERDPSMVGHEKISSFQKVKIYGSAADYILIEYKYAEGSSASYPWKYQFLFTSQGTLIETMSALRFEWISIFKDENPFLLVLSSTSKGNGGHDLYRISGDKLENVLDDELDYFLRTYDAHEDNVINRPYEMMLLIEDKNADGLNDISFSGKVILLQAPIGNGDWIDGEVIDGKKIDYSISSPFKEMNVEFVFLFDKKSGHFKMKEDYNLKYQELKN